MKLNEAALKPEYIFFSYDDVIRTAMPAVYKRLDALREYYKDFIKYDKLDINDDYSLLRSIQARPTYNPLISLGKKTFEYDASFMSMCADIHDIYKESPDMVMTRTLNILSKESFIKKIFIYNPYGGQNIIDDIQSITGTNSNKVTYLTGELSDVLAKMTDIITLYVVNDINTADYIMNNAKTQCADILIANYGYNYKLSEDKKPILKIPNIEDKATEKGFRVQLFMPFFKETLIPKV